MYIPSFALPIYKTCHAKSYLYRSVQYRYLRNVTYEYEKNMYIVTPRWSAAAAVVSAVVL